MHSVNEPCLNIFFEVWLPVWPVSQPSNAVPKSFRSISSLQMETVAVFPQMDTLSLKY